VLCCGFGVVLGMVVWWVFVYCVLDFVCCVVGFCVVLWIWCCVGDGGVVGFCVLCCGLCGWCYESLCCVGT